MSNFFNNINIVKQLTKYIYNNTADEKKNKENQVLDPLCAIIRLGLLKFKPAGTKLSITDNKISFNDPSIFQPAIRYYYGDSRNNMHNLFNPIQKIIVWYDIKNEKIKYLLTNAKEGLENLKKSYDDIQNSNLILHTLNFYIEIIVNILDNNLDNHAMSETTDIYSVKLKDLWSESQINIIYSIFSEINNLNENGSNSNSEITSLIESIEIITSFKENKVKNIVNRISTTL
jgi:hypothetical protein